MVCHKSFHNESCSDIGYIADDKIQDLVYQTEHIQGLPIEADIGVSTKDGDALRK
jgi:hypothetical protein